MGRDFFKYRDAYNLLATLIDFPGTPGLRSAIDNGKALETAGARPKSDRRRLEKTLIAPHPDHSEIARLSYMNPEPDLQAGLGVSCAAA